MRIIAPHANHSHQRDKIVSQSANTQPRRVRLYGVPMDLGQNRRGVDMGPSAIRYAGLQPRLEALGWQVRDAGNLSVPVKEAVSADEMSAGYPAYHLSAIATVASQSYHHAAASFQAGETVVFLGGDHSIALGSVAGALSQSDRVGVIWVDAHGDFNSPKTSPSGNIHGMVVRSLMGEGPELLVLGERHLRPDQIVMIGVRDLDAQERVDLRTSGIKVFTMREIDENGIADVMYAALRVLGDVDAIHVSFDMDSLDPSIAPGVGTPVAGGLNYREAHLLMEMLADDHRVRSLDLVEVNPILDISNRTAEIAVGMAASLFGQRIL
ncbi:MAG: arginase [Anaerolineae bacterium]|nr:arginase [Anaerolineae bacterium]